MTKRNPKKSYHTGNENWVSMYVTVVKKNYRIVLAVPAAL